VLATECRLARLCFITITVRASATLTTNSHSSLVYVLLQLAESDIIEHLEGMCDPSKPDGAWISHYDIVEKGTELKLVDTGNVSGCDCALLKAHVR
jgi:hypothetical protein